MLASCAFVSYGAISQSFLYIIDSLQNEIRTTSDDLEKSLLHLEMAKTYSMYNDTTALAHLNTSLLLNNAQSTLERSKYYLERASVFENLELYDSALATYIAVKRLPGVKDYPETVARTYQQEGNCRFLLGHIIECNPPFRKAISIYSELKMHKEEAQCLNLLGQAQQYLGNYSNALKHYFSAKDICQKVDDQKGLADVLSNIGTVYTFQKDYKVALETYANVLEIRQELKDKDGEADCYNKRGVVYLKRRKYQNALNEYLKALKILKHSNNVELKAQSFYNVGNIYELQDNYRIALDYYRQAFDIYNTTGNIYGKSKTHLSLGRTLMKFQKIQLAGEHLLLALKDAKPTGSADILLEIYEELANYYAAVGQVKPFQHHWQKFKTIHDTLYTTDKARVLKELQTLETLKQSKEIDAIKTNQKVLETELADIIDKEKKKERLFFSLVILLLLALAGSLLILVGSARKSRKRMELKNVELQETLLSKEEKEVLLKEIHHRVKNNMQIITSLLRLQSVNIEDEYIQSLYHESQNRIKSMALIHEELYQSQDLNQLDIKNYLEKLINNLILNYSLGTTIRFETSVNVGKLGIDTLIPLGLLLNEIISNSFRHGFSNRENGNIYVNIQPIQGKEIQLEVGDDGSGFINDPETGESLGYELIESLVEQLEGSMTVRSDNGVHYSIQFFEQ